MCFDCKLSSQVNNDRSRDYTIPNAPVVNTQPSILGQQPYQVGGPGGPAYNGTQYAPAPDHHGGPPPHSTGWNPGGPAMPQSMPMQMHNYHYGPPPGTPPMGQNGMPHSSPMRPYHHQ